MTAAATEPKDSGLINQNICSGRRAALGLSFSAGPKQRPEWAHGASLDGLLASDWRSGRFRHALKHELDVARFRSGHRFNGNEYGASGQVYDLAEMSFLKVYRYAIQL